ncbi:MAG: hypothetical protein K0R18_689 [Bacillales bacterium]|nr:hypothetical protein [Bacillales bacterium]
MTSVITLVFVYVIFRVFFGVYWSDETFIISEYYGFSNGQELLSGSWSYYQFGTILLAPIASLYHLITGSTIGIVLFFRILFCLVQLSIGLFTIYQLTKCFSPFVGTVSYIVFMLFAPLSIYNFSYNNILIQALWVSCISLYLIYYENTLKKNYLYCLTGIFLSFAALMYPSSVIFNIIFFLIMILLHLKRKRKISDGLPIIAISYFSLPLLVLGILILQNSFTEIHQNLIMFLKGAKSYNDNSTDSIFNVFLSQYIYFFKNYCNNFVFKVSPFIVYLFSGTIIVFLSFSNNLRKLVPFLFFVLTGYLFVIYVKYNSFSVGSVNFLGYYISLLTILLYLIVPKKREELGIMISFILPTFILAWIVCFTSNTRMIATSAILIVLVIPFLCYFEKFVLGFFKYFNKMLNISLAVVLCSSLLYMRTTTDYMSHFVYDSPSVKTLSVQLKNGPCAGIFVSPDRAYIYDAISKDIKKDIHQNDRLAVTSCLPWVYLLTDAVPAVSFNWAAYPEKDRDVSFYKINPKNTPTVILVMDQVAELIAPPVNAKYPFYDYIEQNYNLVDTREFYKVYRLK